MACPGAPWASTISDRLEYEVAGLEKIHSIDAELTGHAGKHDVKLQSLCGSAFLCLLCACLPSLIIYK